MLGEKMGTPNEPDHDSMDAQFLLQELWAIELPARETHAGIELTNFPREAVAAGPVQCPQCAVAVIGRST